MSGGGNSAADLTALLDSIAGFTTIFEDLFSLEVTAANSAVVQAENASTSAAAAATSAASVSTLAADAATSANQAVVQAGTAVSEAVLAQTAATNAGNSATAAAASATAAQAAATAAQSVQASLGTLYELNTTGGTVTLNATQAGASIIWVTGVLSSNLNIVIPATVHPFILDNSTTGTGTLTVQMAGGTASTTVGQGNANQLFCDGATGIYSVSSVSGLQFTGVKPISTATNVLTNQYQGAYTPMSNGGSTTFQVTLPTGATMGVGGAVFLDAISGKWSVVPAGSDTADFGASFAMNAADKVMLTWNGSAWRTTIYTNQSSPVFSQSLTVPVAYITGRAVLGGVADDGTTALQATTGRFTTSLTVPTMTAGDNSFNAANTAFVYAAIQALIGGAPGNLDTLNELAAAINDNTSFATSITNLIATKAAISGQTFTGGVQAPTVTATTSMQTYGYGSNNSAGMLYLGSSGSAYLLYDGTNYNLPGGQLYIDSYEAWHTGNFTPANYAALASAANTFQGSVTGTAAEYALLATNGTGVGQTSIGLRQVGAATDQHSWEMIALGTTGSFGIRAINDAYNNGSYAMLVKRGTGYTLETMTLMGNGGRVLVGSGVTDDGTTMLQVNGSVLASNYYIGGQGTGDSGLFGFSDVNGPSVTAYGSGTSGAGALVFKMATVEAMRISPAGNLLIGTTTDDGVNLLQVNGGLHLLKTSTGITFPDGTQQLTAYAVTNPTVNTYTPAAGATVIPTQTYGLGLIQVFESGAYLVPGQDYTATTGNSITLNTAANGRNSYTVMTGALFNASNVIQPNVVVVPATVGNTSITLPSTTMQGYLWIFQGGAWLQPGVDFTFNGGTAVTLLNAPTESTDSFTLVMLQPVSFANTATQTNVQNAQLTFALDTGAANAYAVTYIPAVGAPVNGMQLSFYVKTANTGASTLTCNGGTAYPIYGNGHAALSGGELIAGGFVEVFFNTVLGAWILLENTGGTQQNAGNLNFIGEANRITGDMSNATYSNQMAFQSSAVNGFTSVNAIPNGTGVQTQFVGFNNSNPTNSAYIDTGVNSTFAYLNSGILGTGTYLPLAFIAGGAERARFLVNGNLVFGATTTTAMSLPGVVSVSSTANITRFSSYGYGNGQGYGIVFQAGLDSGASPVYILNAAGVNIGSIGATSSAVAYNTTSDYRLKHYVKPLKGALARVAELNVVTYRFKNDPNQEEHDGFLAHELAKTVPRAVTGVKDAIWHNVKYREGTDMSDIQQDDVLEVTEEIVPQLVDHSKMVPLLSAALQEANDRIEALEKDREEMKKQIQSLIVHVEGLKRK